MVAIDQSFIELELRVAQNTSKLKRSTFYETLCF